MLASVAVEVPHTLLALRMPGRHLLESFARVPSPVDVSTLLRPPVLQELQQRLEVLDGYIHIMVRSATEFNSSVSKAKLEVHIKAQHGQLRAAFYGLSTRLAICM